MVLERAVLERRRHFADDAADVESLFDVDALLEVESLLDVESVCVDADPEPVADVVADDVGVVSDAVTGAWDDSTGAVDVDSGLVDVGVVEDPVPEADEPLDEEVATGATGVVTLDAGTVTDVVATGAVATPVDVGLAVDPTLVRDRAAVESAPVAAPEFEIS